MLKDDCRKAFGRSFSIKFKFRLDLGVEGLVEEKNP